MTNENLQRRRRVVFVPEHLVLSFLNRPLSDVVRVPQPLNLPADVRAVSAHHDWQRNAFAVVIEHESFEEVSENCMLPEIEVEWHQHEIEVRDLTV